MNGIIQSGGNDVLPIVGATGTLYDSDAGVIGRPATTDSEGRFTIPSPTPTPGIYYATAFMPGKGVTLLAVIGPQLPPSITINELTTIAGAYSAAQFISGGQIAGSNFALQIVAGMNLNLVEIQTGTSSVTITSPPNADQTSSWRTTSSLANLLATCVRGTPSALHELYILATPPGGSTPADTITAIANIARNPANHVGGIFAQARAIDIYQPALELQPDAWTIVVKVNDSGSDEPDGQMFSGPGSLAFDSEGRAWITNNTIQGTPDGTKYGIVLDAAGRPAANGSALMTPYTGGGLLGGGYGIAIDGKRQIWMSDFGWGANKPPEGGVSVFTQDAVPVSPDPHGYTTAVHRVQGIAIDRSDNVWIAGYESNSVAVYIGGNPATNSVATYFGDSSFKPFGIAIASDGTAWVANGDQAGSVVHFRLNGLQAEIVSNTPVGKVLKGIAIDSAGNVWVASGGDDHVYVLDPNGNVTGAFQGGGINGPWGLCLDGADNPWIGNFGPLEQGTNFHGRLTQLAGINAVNSTTQLGDGLTPQTGFTLPSAGAPVTLHNGEPLYGETGPPCRIPMMRTTGLQVDAAGNVWTCNNWKPDFDIDTKGGNPGGDGMLIWVGVATPMASA
jgi:sugar lactone lactonase YvrE